MSGFVNALGQRLSSGVSAARDRLSERDAPVMGVRLTTAAVTLSSTLPTNRMLGKRIHPSTSNAPPAPRAALASLAVTALPCAPRVGGGELTALSPAHPLTGVLLPDYLQ